MKHNFRSVAKNFVNSARNSAIQQKRAILCSRQLTAWTN